MVEFSSDFYFALQGIYMKKKLFFLTFFTSLTFSIFSQNSAQIQFAEKLQKILESGTLNDAINLFEEIPESLKNDKDLMILKSSLLLSAEDYKKSKEIADNLLASNPNDVQVLELKAQIAVGMDDNQTLKTVSEKLLTLNPYNPTANIIKANQFVLRKNYKQADVYYKKALVGEPDNLEALFAHGKMNYYLGDLKESEKAFMQVLEFDKYNSDSYQYLGKLSAERENYIAAVKNLETAIKINPEIYDYYIDYGQYKRNLGKFDDAEKAWTKAIEIQPDYFLAYTYRAGLYDEQNKIELALDDYKKIVETNPKYYFAYEEMGILQFHLKKWEEARNSFIKANGYRKDWSYELMIVATFLKEKNTFKAKEFAQKFMKPMDRKSLEYLMMRLYCEQGPVNAESALARSIEKEENKNKRGKLLYYMGLYYDLKNLPQAAVEYYEKVTQMQTPLFFEYRIAEWGLQ